MSKEWYQFCKDCQREFGYSDFSYESGLKRGHSRPERCLKHLQQHALEIRDIASSHFGLVPRQGPPSILGSPYLGSVEHGKRELQPKKILPDNSGMDLGIKDHNEEDYDICDVYDALKECQVLVVEGPTGCGKSTYIPFRLIDPLPPYEKDHFTKHGAIIVTQPRIQATRGVPDTIGKKLLGASIGPGFEIGYRHGDAFGKGEGEHYDSRNRLIFVTDGTLLNWIAAGKASDYSIIMIDEAHERSRNIDLILGLIKRELLKYPHLRLIVASATIDAAQFVEYYKEVTSVKLLPFKGKRNCGYDLHWWTGSPIEEEDLPAKVAEKVIEILKITSDGGILGFLHGKDEIEAAVKIIRENLKGRKDVMVFPLYTALGVRYGKESLRPLPNVQVNGRWKTPRRVVIATNIAETSLTIPDIVYVIDSGRIKQNVWNPLTCRQELIPTRHSKDGCKQRWGRAGRVRHGEVFTLYTKEEYDKDFPDHTPPEITRECLDDVILSTKAAGITDLSSFSWLETPNEVEMNRSHNVIQKRKIVDIDGDMTEEGIELYRLSRWISRFLDKYDYNSTQRALDVASLLILADRYACLIEAVTALLMMPRMGNSLYWEGDGLLVWDRGWNLESKDIVGRIQAGLRIGCRDDLDFALKLFALYEQNISGFPEILLRNKDHHFLNISNFALLDEARRKILESFFMGRKDEKGLLLRPIDFSLIPRLRVLMAIAWPDRVFSLKHGNPPRFIASSGDDMPCQEGIVSRLSCWSWEESNKAIVALMNKDNVFIEGKMQSCPMANFLVRLPDKIPSKEDVSEIVTTLSSLRKEYDKQKVYTRIFADQYVPLGSRVRLETYNAKPRVEQILQLPNKFIPVKADISDEDKEFSDSYNLYEHQPAKSDTVELELYNEEQQIEDEETIDIHFIAERLKEENIPVFEGQWVSKIPAKEVTIVGWIEKNEQIVALLDAIDQVSLQDKVTKKLRPGDRIKVVLERAVHDMYSGSLIGFMSRDHNGLVIPIPVNALSISLYNPGLVTLEGKTIQVTVIGYDPLCGCLFTTILPEAEEDLEKLLKLEEVEGRIVEITKKGICIAIDSKGGFIHSALIPIERVPKVVDDLFPGSKVILSIKLRIKEKENASVSLQGDYALSPKDISELERRSIAFKNGCLVCNKSLPYSSIDSLLNSLPPALTFVIRRLYAQSWALHAFILETTRSLKVFEELYREACQIRDKAKTIEPEITRDKIKALRPRIQNQSFSSRFYDKLKEVLDEARSIQQIADSQAFIQRKLAFIQRRHKEIADLDEMIRSTTSPEKILQRQGWIREKKQDIQEAEQSIRDAKKKY